MEIMKPGDKYVSIKLSISEKFINAYPNKTKKNDNEPDFKGDGVAVWVHEAKGKQQKIEEIKIKSPF